MRGRPPQTPPAAARSLFPAALMAVEKVLAQKGLKWATVRAKSPGWLWHCVRRFIPEKDLLHRNLQELFDFWGNIKCKVTGRTLFSEETWKKAKGVLHDVKKEWISDPSAIPLYTVNGSDNNGLALYNCILSTNSVERGVHNSIRKNFGSLNASPELTDALLADFRHRHNVEVHCINGAENMRATMIHGMNMIYPNFKLISSGKPNQLLFNGK
jgi:hypothetical protein